MKMTRIAALLSLTVVGSALVFIAVANHEERVPEVYYSLDKTKPWNELARSLDPRMSDGEYNKMRSMYFYDVVAPKLSESDKLGGYLRFMQQTDRPWQWDRRRSRGEPPRAVLLVFWVSAAYLVVVSPVWAWKKVFQPVGLIARDDGLAGVAQVILHGRKSKPKERGMARGTFHLVRFDEDGGLKGKSEKRRLVCVIDSGGKLAIWGQEVPSRIMQNIDLVLKIGMPCTVECEYREPEEWATKFGHTHWVAQDFELHVKAG